MPMPMPMPMAMAMPMVFVHCSDIWIEGGVEDSSVAGE